MRELHAIHVEEKNNIHVNKCRLNVHAWNGRRRDSEGAENDCGQNGWPRRWRLRVALEVVYRSKFETTWKQNGQGRRGEDGNEWVTEAETSSISTEFYSFVWASLRADHQKSRRWNACSSRQWENHEPETWGVEFGANLVRVSATLIPYGNIWPHSTYAGPSCQSSPPYMGDVNCGNL